MITSLAIDKEFAYTLDSGVITRTQLTALDNQDTYTGPSGVVVSQIMTTNESVYALTEEDGVFVRDNDMDIWEPVAFPEDTAYLSSSDDYLYALVDGQVWQREIFGHEFTLIPQSISVTAIAQIDHDEQFGYALLESGQIWLRKLPSQHWSQYRSLASTLQVVAGLDFIYARTSDGNVWRSKVFGESGWEQLRTDDVTLLAIASDHVDRLWMIRGGSLTSVSIFDFGKPADTAWIDADWIDGDWIEVA